MKVQSRVRIPSPLLSSLTSRITLNSRKKVIEMRELSSAFCRGVESRVNTPVRAERKRNYKAPGCALAPGQKAALCTNAEIYLLSDGHYDDKFYFQQDSKTKAPYLMFSRV